MDKTVEKYFEIWWEENLRNINLDDKLTKQIVELPSYKQVHYEAFEHGWMMCNVFNSRDTSE